MRDTERVPGTFVYQYCTRRELARARWRQILTLCGQRKRRKEKERKRKKKERKERKKKIFSMINVNNLNTLFRYLLRFMLSGPLKFKGCFALKYFSPRRHYILNLPNCSISNDFFCGSSTFSIYGSLVHKIYNFLWPQEF